MKNKKPLKCPYCSFSGHPFFLYNAVDYFKCVACGLVFRDHRLDRRGYIFEEQSLDQTSGTRDALFKLILQNIEIERPRGNLLDVGCGIGSFLKMAMDGGWHAKGIDFSHEAIRRAGVSCGDSAVQGTLQDINDHDAYDVITMINVLDHTDEPWHETRRALALLKRNGLLYLRFPNGTFHQTLWRGIPAFSWGNLIRKQCIFHRYSFTKRFIRPLLEHQGYEGIVARNSAVSAFIKPFFPGKERVNRPIRKGLLLGFRLLDISLGHRVLWGPSLTITARKKG